MIDVGYDNYDDNYDDTWSIPDSHHSTEPQDYIDYEEERRIEIIEEYESETKYLFETMKTARIFVEFDEKFNEMSRILNEESIRYRQRIKSYKLLYGRDTKE